MSIIDEYLSKVDASQRVALERVRSIVKQAVPDAEEAIAYGMPTFKYKKKNLFHFAAFKDHMSLFPTSEPVEVFRDQLKGFKVSKGTIQFTEGHPVPEATIKALVAHRMQSIDKS
jgi:uncharacterized protein YdhG (YjbR/CyaY superfamily)